MATSKQSDQAITGLRVLVVEDENLVALLLEDLLAELGHIVIGPVARLIEGTRPYSGRGNRPRYSRRQYQWGGDIPDR
jgi:hypothetical protein